MHKHGSIGNAVRDLAPGATFRVHGDGLALSDLEWLDDGITRPTDQEIDARADYYDENGVSIP